MTFSLQSLLTHMTSLARARTHTQRIATVKALCCLDGPPCPELDVLLSAVRECWNAPNACITLLGIEHVWLSNPCNADAAQNMQCISWSVAMCPWTLLDPHPVAMAVGDLEKDARFCGNVHHKVGASVVCSALFVFNGSFEHAV